MRMLPKTDIDKAAERISRVMQGESIESVYGPDGMDRLCMDHKMLVCAYLAQSPSHTAQAAELAELRAKVEALTALRTAAAPFEDSRVVDRDWLIANGFERADDTLPVFIRRINDVTVEAYCYKSKVSITVYDDYNAASRNYVKLLTNPTIGQLNHLLAALKPGGAK